VAGHDRDARTLRVWTGSFQTKWSSLTLLIGLQQLQELLFRHSSRPSSCRHLEKPELQWHRVATSVWNQLLYQDVAVPVSFSHLDEMMHSRQAFNKDKTP